MVKFKTKIILMNVLISIFVASAIIISCMVDLNIKNKQTIGQYENILREEYDHNIKNQVDNVISLMNGIYDKQVNGKITEDEAKEEMKYLIKQLRYEDTKYFWIDDTDGILIAHPILEEQEGRNRINETDKLGNKLISKIVDVSKNPDGGYCDFYYQKPDDTSDNVYRKRSYSKLFKPYNWVVSTGNYTDDIDQLIQTKILDLKVTIAELL